jgi:hypothetical protein
MTDPTPETISTFPEQSEHNYPTEKAKFMLFLCASGIHVNYLTLSLQKVRHLYPWSWRRDHKYETSGMGKRSHHLHLEKFSHRKKTPAHFL